MYVPQAFREVDLSVLHDAIERTGLATLVTAGRDGPEASHVPMLLERGAGPLGTLHGHLARANPQWRGAATDATALAMFLGPDAYVTPSWYPTKQRTGEVVPTWNYVAVHARGLLRFFDDQQQLLALVTRLTDTHERGRSHPWAVSDAPADYIRANLSAIVGFELRIATLDGKWKMSQNRSVEDRQGVADGLDCDGASAVAGLVRGLGRDDG